MVWMVVVLIFVPVIAITWYIYHENLKTHYKLNKIMKALNINEDEDE